MLRNVLDIMQRNKTVKGRLDENIRSARSEGHLKSVPSVLFRHTGIYETAHGFVELLRSGKRRDLPPGRRGRQLLSDPIGFVKVTRFTHRIWCSPTRAAADTLARSDCSPTRRRTAT